MVFLKKKKKKVIWPGICTQVVKEQHDILDPVGNKIFPCKCWKHPASRWETITIRIELQGQRRIQEKLKYKSTKNTSKSNIKEVQYEYTVLKLLLRHFWWIFWIYPHVLFTQNEKRFSHKSHTSYLVNFCCWMMINERDSKVPWVSFFHTSPERNTSIFTSMNCTGSYQRLMIQD